MVNLSLSTKNHEIDISNKLDNTSYPKGWGKRKLSDTMNFLGGNAFKSKDSTDTGVRWLKIANVGFGRVQWATLDYLPKNFEVDYAKYLLGEDDIVMALTRPILGGKLKIAKVTSEDQPSLLNQRVAKITANHGYCLEYLYFLLSKRSTVSAIENAIAGTDPPNLGFNDLKKVQVMIPNDIVEQEKIASIISTWEKAVSLKEKLIEQKQEQYRGLMQILLTGKFRLPGFKEKWEKIKLGEIGSFLKGKGISKSETEEVGINSIRYGEIYTVHHFYIKKFYSFISSEVAKNSQEIINNDILFAGSGETAEEIGKAVAYIDNKPAYAGGDIIILRPTLEVDSLFLSYLLNVGEIAKERAKLGQGNSVVHIYPKSLSSLNVTLPSYKEQCEISKILKTADNEIELLDQELEALKKQKIGLMQLLLTGKVRVKV